VLEEVLVQGVRNLQPTDERECRDILTAVGDFGKLALEEVDVWFEVVSPPYIDREKMIVVLLGLMARDVLSEERFGYPSKLRRERGDRE